MVIDLIQESGGYVMCPGIEPTWYEEKYKIVGYKRKSVREFNFPLKRYESVDCFLWHKPCNRFAVMGDRVFNVCSKCKHESRYLAENAERISKVDRVSREARTHPSSKYPIAKLSPNDQSIKVERLKKELKLNRDKVEKLLKQTSKSVIGTVHYLYTTIFSLHNMYLGVSLSSDQDIQMVDVVSSGTPDKT